MLLKLLQRKVDFSVLIWIISVSIIATGLIINLLSLKILIKLLALYGYNVLILAHNNILSMTDAVRNPSWLPGTSGAELRKPLKTVASKTGVNPAQTFSPKPILPVELLEDAQENCYSHKSCNYSPAGNFQTNFLNRYEVSPTPSLCPHGS